MDVPGNQIMCGYVGRRSHHQEPKNGSSPWKRRLLVLTEQYLAWFKVKQDVNKEEVRLPTVTNAGKPALMVRDCSIEIHEPNTFIVTYDNVDYVFQTASTSDFIEWIQAISPYSSTKIEINENKVEAHPVKRQMLLERIPSKPLLKSENSSAVSKPSTPPIPQLLVSTNNTPVQLSPVLQHAHELSVSVAPVIENIQQSLKQNRQKVAFDILNNAVKTDDFLVQYLSEQQDQIKSKVFDTYGSDSSALLLAQLIIHFISSNDNQTKSVPALASKRSAPPPVPVNKPNRTVENNNTNMLSVPAEEEPNIDVSKMVGGREPKLSVFMKTQGRRPSVNSGSGGNTTTSNTRPMKRRPSRKVSTFLLQQVEKADEQESISNIKDVEENKEEEVPEVDFEAMEKQRKLSKMGASPMLGPLIAGGGFPTLRKTNLKKDAPQAPPAEQVSSSASSPVTDIQSALKNRSAKLQEQSSFVPLKPTKAAPVFQAPAQEEPQKVDFRVQLKKAVTDEQSSETKTGPPVPSKPTKVTSAPQSPAQEEPQKVDFRAQLKKAVTNEQGGEAKITPTEEVNQRSDSTSKFRKASFLPEKEKNDSSSNEFNPINKARAGSVFVASPIANVSPDFRNQLKEAQNKRNSLNQLESKLQSPGPAVAKGGPFSPTPIGGSPADFRSQLKEAQSKRASLTESKEQPPAEEKPFSPLKVAQAASGSGDQPDFRSVLNKKIAASSTPTSKPKEQEDSSGVQQVDFRSVLKKRND
jgi:hypothetical protein